MIKFHTAKSPNTKKDAFKYLTAFDLDYMKKAFISKYEAEGHTVETVDVKKGVFLGYSALVIVAQLKDQPYLNGVPIYKKEITFLVKDDHQVAFIYFLPQSIATTKEIGLIDKQIKTSKAF